MTIFCILYIFISKIAAISLVSYWFPLLTAVFFIAGCIKIANQNSFHASETFQHKKGEQVVQLLKKVLLFIILIELLIAEVTYTPLEHCKIDQCVMRLSLYTNKNIIKFKWSTDDSFNKTSIKVNMLLMHTYSLNHVYQSTVELELLPKKFAQNKGLYFSFDLVDI